MGTVRTMVSLTLCSLLLAAAPVDADEETFAAKDLAGWRLPTGGWRVAGAVGLDPADARRLRIEPGTGVFVNGRSEVVGTPNLVTQAEYADVEVQLEFLLPRGSNSGVYLMGRYEIQVLDRDAEGYGGYPGGQCGGIYPRWIGERNVGGTSPRMDAAGRAGEWQRFEIVFRAPRFDARGRKIANARFVRVAHNGVVVHENVEVDGPTRASIADDERPAGPLMLQGDHGPVAYRNLRVREL
jgi:hypothetical protein